MKTRDEILATWDTEGIYTEWLAIDSYDPTDGKTRRLFVGPEVDCMQMMREYYATPDENALGSFHRCTYIGADAARAFFEGEVDELPDERGVYSATEAAAILDVSRMRVNQLLNEGKLEGRKVGHAWQVYRYSVENRLRETGESWKHETYATIDDFIGQAILPTLGDFADDYDLEGIADEVVDFDGRALRWKREYVDDIDAYNEVCQRHDKSADDDE